MDFNSLRDQVANISLYDVKASIRKVQNAVMNYTEMEAKVREATNNEPWGASSTMMQEIANATFNYQLLNEIMPMVYKRFTEKAAEEWRQIYKALQLLEFLVKHGSERVIDDARSHMSLLKMLRQFHFIDQNGKDQGVNVRNRSKELVELLSDVERIRTERKKARASKNKYSGVEGGAGLGSSSAGGSRYGGFGSESAGAGYGGTFGAAGRGVYGDGGGFGGENTNDEYEEGGRTGGNDRFDEYDEFDDGGAQAAPARRKAATTSSTTQRATPKKADPPKPKEPEVDLFDFGDDPLPTSTNSGSLLAPAPSAAAFNAPPDDDDFDDFQSAAPTPAPAAVPALPKPNYSSFSTLSASSTPSIPLQQPTPQSSSQMGSFNSLLATTSPPPTSGMSTPSGFSAQSKPQGYKPTGPNYFTSVQTQPVQQASTGLGSQPSNGKFGTQTGAAKKPAGGDAFADLLGGAGFKKTSSPAQKGLTIADMAKQKSQAGLYGANAPASGSAGSTSRSGGGAMDDLMG